MFLRLFQKIIRLSFQTIMKTNKLINIENKKKIIYLIQFNIFID